MSNQQLETPSHITKTDLSRNTKMLRDLALNGGNFALPLLCEGFDVPATVASLGAGLNALKAQKATINDVASLRHLVETINQLQDNQSLLNRHVVFVTIAARKNEPAAGLIFYFGPGADRFMESANNYQNGRFPKINGQAPIITNSNSDHSAIKKEFSRLLRNGNVDTLLEVENGYLVAQRGAEFAILNRQSALALKAQLFPGDSNIMKDVPARELNQKFGSMRDLILSGKMFARVIIKNKSGSEKERDLCMIPGYAAEFLNLDTDGKITGVKESKTLSVQFKMSAEIDTDFVDKTRFRINSEDPGKLALVERAFRQAREEPNTIVLQGIERSIRQTGRERRIHGTRGHIKFTDNITVSFTLHADGKTEDLKIGNGRQNALLGPALKLPAHVDLVFRGRNYSLDLT